jgi:hypothetical protein
MKGDKEVASAVKEANKLKQSSPSGVFLEPREKGGKKAGAPTTQVISEGSKHPSPFQASREAGASNKKPMSAAKQDTDETKQAARQGWHEVSVNDDTGQFRRETTVFHSTFL